MSKSHGAREQQQQQPEHPTLEANSAPTASHGTSRTEHGTRVPSLSTTFSRRPISKSSFGASGTSVALRALKSPLHIRKGKSRIEIWKNLKASSIPRRTTTFCPSKQVGTMNKIHAQCQTCSLEMCCRSVQEDAHFGAVTLLLLAKRRVWRILCFQSMSNFFLLHVQQNWETRRTRVRTDRFCKHAPRVCSRCFLSMWCVVRRISVSFQIRNPTRGGHFNSSLPSSILRRVCQLQQALGPRPSRTSKQATANSQACVQPAPVQVVSWVNPTSVLVLMSWSSTERSAERPRDSAINPTTAQDERLR